MGVMEGCDLVYGDWYEHSIFSKRSNLGLWGLVGRGMGTSGGRDGDLRGRRLWSDIGRIIR